MMDMTQYITVFLEEANEHLQVLNQSLLKLENDHSDTATLDEVFRVAHTLKGMSATMGFNNMAELTHAMENLLQQIRSGELVITSALMDLLFHCLDILEVMVNDITESGTTGVETKTLIRELEDAGKNRKNLQQEQVVNDLPQPEPDNQQKTSLNEYERSLLIESTKQGFENFEIKVVLQPGCLLKAARAYLVFRRLEELGEIIKTEPKVEDIEDEKFDLDFTVILVSKAGREQIIKVIEGVSEVEHVAVTKIEVIEEKQSLHENAVAVSTAPEKPEHGELSDLHSKRLKTSQTVRVDTERLDNLMNLVGELVINKIRLQQISKIHNFGELSETVEAMDRLTTDLQTIVMKVRMVPVSQVFNRFPRMVRDLAKELGKEINFVMEGEETELDRTVIDEIGDPLMHLIRNAVDHGIESPHERHASGKPLTSLVKLVARHEGNHVVIEVEDDGRGIDPELIKRKAVDKGLLSVQEAERMEPNQLYQIVFQPGFSTADVVTDISGRGVGLDVVKTKIESLGGTVNIESKLGVGCKFIINLPLTLAIIQALMVSVGNENYAIPLSFIDRTLQITQDDIKTIQNKEVITLRGSVLPLIRLSEILEVPSEQHLKSEDLYVVVVKLGERRSGLVVDTLIGQLEIVIKSMGNLLSGIKEIAGATILANGQVALILDVAHLI